MFTVPIRHNHNPAHNPSKTVRGAIITDFKNMETSSELEETPHDESTIDIDESSTISDDVNQPKLPNKMLEFSEESTQAIFDEIEVQHQSHQRTSPESWKNDLREFHRGGEKSGRGIAIPGKSWIDNQRSGRGRFDKMSMSLDSDNTFVSRSKVRSWGKGMDSSSEEQSASTWFPVPSLFQSKSHMGHVKPESSPPSSANTPFDEKLARQNASSPYRPRNQTSGAQSPTRNEFRNHGSPRIPKSERPWHTNSQKKHSEPQNAYEPQRRSSSPNRNPRGSRSPMRGQSPSRYRNPFSSVSSDSTFMEQSQSFQSMKSQYDDIPQFHAYKNPFDSMSTSTDHWHLRSMNRSRSSRLSSKSPERQRIIKPTPSVMNKENKLHSLISCATSPSDPKWMEALRVLTTAPNPTKLAQVKLAHAHNWTALHIAALSNPPLYLIYGLLLVYPDAVKEMDTGGRLPIHLASGSEASVSVLSILVRFYDYSVVVEEGRGLTPLHLALLRDGEEDMSTDVIRVLLGQNDISKRRPSFGRKVKDGCMRRGEHLNLRLEDVRTGIFGENPNTIFMKERRKREMRMKNMTAQNRQSYSRGFARDMQEVSSADGTPYKHEYLASLWEEEGVMDVDIFGNVELDEAQNFDMEVQHCLKKLAKWRKTNKEDQNTSQSNKESEKGISPATIPAPNLRLPIHMAIKRNYKVAKSFRLPTQKQNDILRILIHANPLSLMHRDISGKTPIMACLELACNDAEYQIDLEMVELLLGIGTAGFRIAPEWLEDIDFVESQQKLISEGFRNDFNEYTTYNPAMVPYGQTLPLHFVVSQPLSPSIFQTIYFCYPGAKYIQDERNCTPLHCFLQRLSTDDILDLNILYFLIDEKVARMRDLSNKSALDLLIENCKKGRIPSYSNTDIPWKRKIEEFSSTDVKSQLQVLFQHSFLEASTSSATTSKSEENLENLRFLPPWLRNYAFEMPAVQKKLIAKVSLPISTAFIMVNGTVLLMLIIFFMSSLDVMLIQGRSIPQAYVMIVILSFMYLALSTLCSSLTAFRIQIGWGSCIFNFWFWITFLGIVIPFITFLHLINYKSGFDELEEHVIVLCTISIGLLWAMVIGFISRWCYGVSLLCSSTIKMIQHLIPTFAVFFIFLASFSQMIYVTQRQSLGLNGGCMDLDDGGISKVCTLWSSIKISYHLATGGELPRSGDPESQGLQVLFLLFIISIFILILHSVAASIANMNALLSTKSMVDFYWIPLFIHILFVKDVSDIFSRRKVHNITEGTQPTSQRRLEITWDFICSSFECTSSKNSRWGYLQRDLGNFHLLTNILFVRLVGVFVIPIWLILGLLTFGILWPPQCRRWLFTWSFAHGCEKFYAEKEKCTSSSTILHEDISKMKGMVYQRFHDVQSELYDIKRFIS